MTQSINFLLFMIFSYTAMAAPYNVVDFGAKADGRTDSAKAFLTAWTSACAANSPASMYVPSGRFLLSQALFRGPCSNKAIRITIDGTIVGPPGYTSLTKWITFQYVEGVSIYGGTLDGRGKSLWDCKLAARQSCPVGAHSLTIGQSKNVLIRGMTLLDSEIFHIAIYASNGVTVQGVKIIAPDESPNTDGIHIELSSNVAIPGSSIMTGDDCISMGQGSTNVRIENVNCGPGHGISIGSLGSTEKQAGVQNITVKSVTLNGTQNGLRIKTWGRPGAGFVKGVRFQDAIMKNVNFPMIIDQNYCPGNINCPGQSSGIKISDVKYVGVQGTSATKVAVMLDCSPSNPCTGVVLQNIKLVYQNNKPAQAFCKNVSGRNSGFVIPNGCLP